MTSDLSSALEVCFKRDALNKSMFTLHYFTLLTLVSQAFVMHAVDLFYWPTDQRRRCGCVLFLEMMSW